MTQIKVSVNNVTQVNELIEYWSDKNINLNIEVKENTVGQDDVSSAGIKGLKIDTKL